MNVARRVAPNYTSQTAAEYKANIDAAFAVDARVGGWFAPHQVYNSSPQPDLAVEIDAGWVFDPSTQTLTEIPAQTVTGFTVPTAGQNRVDRVVIHASTGTALRVAGTAVTGSPTATPPAIPDGYLPCAQVLITSSDASITNSMITDERAIPTAKPASIKVPVRQSILSALLDSSGYNALLSSASPSSLRYSVLAASVAAVFAFAAGHDANGAVDYVSRLTANYVDQGALAASNTNYAYADYVSASSVTFSNCLIPPQYGYTFDRTQASILNFEGTNGATTTTDDFGNTWTFAGNAQISNADKKFGSTSLKLDGTGDYIETTNITSMGSDGWTVEGWVNSASLPTGGNQQNIFNFGQSGSIFGLELALFNSAGTQTLVYYASSNGSTHDIVNGGGAATGALSTGTWYHVAFVFDALAGVYRIYWGGVQIHSTSSSARICALAKARIGSRIDGTTQQWNGYIDGFRMVRACLYPNGTTFTPPAAAPSVTDYKTHFFSIPEMTMYEVTAASASAGTNPTMTARSRLFLGEIDTDAVGVSAIRNYALRGQYKSGLFGSIALNTDYIKSANIGTSVVSVEFWLQNVVADVGHKPGDRIRVASQAYDGANQRGAQSRVLPRGNSVAVTFGSQLPYAINPNGTTSGITGSSWNGELIVNRSF